MIRVEKIFVYSGEWLCDPVCSVQELIYLHLVERKPNAKQSRIYALDVFRVIRLNLRHAMDQEATDLALRSCCSGLRPWLTHWSNKLLSWMSGTVVGDTDLFFFFFFFVVGGLPFTNNVGRIRRQWARAEPHNMEHGNTLFAAQRGPTRLGGGIYNQ